MESIAKGTLDPGQPYIRCSECAYRAYLVSDWEPKPGLEPRLRMFECPDGHQSYKRFSNSDLLKLRYIC